MPHVSSLERTKVAELEPVGQAGEQRCTQFTIEPSHLPNGSWGGGCEIGSIVAQRMFEGLSALRTPIDVPPIDTRVLSSVATT